MSEDEAFPPGTLAVVALPLGNGEDMSPRALNILRAADLIAAEDTRTARRLLTPLGVGAKYLSYHDYNEAARAPRLIEELARGARVALVSDAGTPCISDPGFDLVREARRAGFRVFPAPGPSALVTFLSVSGLPTDAFSFFGFPPSKSGARREFFARLALREETLVFYESPHRVREALEDALGLFGDREAAFGREMTKTYEEFFYGTLSGMAARFSGGERARGEITWGVAGRPRSGGITDEAALEEALARAIAAGRPLKEAAREIGAAFGVESKKIYAALTRLRDNP